MLIKHSRTIGIICAVINMIPWVIFAADCIYTLCLPDSTVHFESKGYAYGFLLIFIGPALLISALGLWGSLIARKKPTLGAVLMLVSGGLILFLATVWWYAVPSLPLIAAGVLALVSNNKESNVQEPKYEKPDPAGNDRNGIQSVLKKLSRVFGFTGSALALIAFLFLFISLAYYPEVFYGSEVHPYSVSAADIISILIAAASLAGSFFIGKKPVLAAVLMIIPGVLLFPFFGNVLFMLLPSFAPWWSLLIPPLLLITAGVLAVVSANKTSGVNEPQNDSPGEQTPPS